MEIISLDIKGYYYYNLTPTTDIIKDECSICKRSVLDVSYENIIDNSKIINNTEISIGKCGHFFHTECIKSWLTKDKNCPIDKTAWHYCRNVDTHTNLVLKSSNNVYNNYNNYKNYNYNTENRKIYNNQVKEIIKNKNFYPNDAVAGPVPVQVVELVAGHNIDINKNYYPYPTDAVIKAQ
jgi:hypothetical protein